MFSDNSQDFALDEYATMQVSSRLEDSFGVDEIESAGVSNPVTSEEIPITGTDCPFATWTPTEFESSDSSPSIAIPLSIFDFSTHNLPNIYPNAKFGSENMDDQKQSLNQLNSNANIGSCIQEAPFSLLESIDNTGFSIMNTQNHYSQRRFESPLIPQEPMFSGNFGTIANSPILDHFDIDFLDAELTASSGNSPRLIPFVCFCI